MKYTNLYKTRVQKTVSDDKKDMMTIFSTAFKSDPKLEIQLINYYKGMPLSFNAKITAIDKDIIELNVYPQQAVAISDDHYTFIRSSLFKHDIVAKAHDVDIKQKSVSLSLISYAELCAERRNHIRLRVNPPIDAIYMSTQGTVRGEIVELSTAGTIMHVDHSVDVDTWEEGKLLFRLPGADQIIKIPAKFITVIDNAMPLLFIFGFTADSLTEKQIAKYLFNRQIEIIRMLKEGCEIG